MESAKIILLPCSGSEIESVKIKESPLRQENKLVIQIDTV